MTFREFKPEELLGRLNETEQRNAPKALFVAGDTSILDRGDVLYDLAFGQDGSLIAVGSCGWTQNPQGASVSEASQKLLVLLDREGGVVERKTLPEGPRHNLLRSVAADSDGAAIVGGFENGPGTHSGDQDPTLIKADLFVTRMRF